jgi:hypothetical protein
MAASLHQPGAPGRQGHDAGGGENPFDLGIIERRVMRGSMVVYNLNFRLVSSTVLV